MAEVTGGLGRLSITHQSVPWVRCHVSPLPISIRQAVVVVQWFEFMGPHSRAALKAVVTAALRTAWLPAVRLGMKNHAHIYYIARRHEGYDDTCCSVVMHPAP